jgi:hypothetical protein
MRRTIRENKKAEVAYSPSPRQDEPINPAQIIARACQAISKNDFAAAAIIAEKYPHTQPKRDRARASIPDAVMIKVFLRDGFVDRYTGRHLVFGPALHLVSQILPEAFPAAKNWKMSGTHRGAIRDR